MAFLLIAIAGLAAAQTQKRKPHKLRATALLELTTDRAGNVKSKLTPICILTDGHFEDASIYKAAPEPMALDNGIVYEAQKSGTPAGYLTITNSIKGSIWTALGKWQVYTAVAKKAAPTPTPSTNPDDGRPHLKRPGESSGTSSTSSSPDAGGSSSGSSTNNDDRPRLHRPNESSSPSPTPTPESSDTSNDDRPKLHRPNDSSASPSPTPSTPAQPQSTSQPQSTPEPTLEPAPDDADRPVLRHRSPSSAAAASTPTPEPKATAGKTPSPQGTVPNMVPKPPDAGTQTMVAVSDNQSGESRSYNFMWKQGEEEEMDAKMRKLALAQLPKENSQLNDGSLKNVVIRSFDLDLSNDAVMVLTAEIPGSYLASAAKPVPQKKTPANKTPRAEPQNEDAAKFVSRYITLIARVDFEGVPQRLAVSVTDSSRLDVAPRLELIDAVDVDGDGLAELLFREYGFDQKGFIVYGVGRSTVTKVFEGASQDMK